MCSILVRCFLVFVFWNLIVMVVDLLGVKVILCCMIVWLLRIVVCMVFFLLFLLMWLGVVFCGLKMVIRVCMFLGGIL